MENTVDNVENATEDMNTSVLSSENNEEQEQQEDVILTLDDVLQIEDELMEDTAAVLGVANDKTCSYVEGYGKRQALYSCLTCIPEAKTDPEKGAGVCLACSYHCHDGHELIELYTKRNFRCDCGNSKFNDFKCNLYDLKTDINDTNSYNQNFAGVYCVCHRPYPDAEDPLPDEMIQCIMCEDWYHSRHLGTPLPMKPFAEMICQACVEEHEFLLHYEDYYTSDNENAEKSDVDVVSTDTPNEDKTDASNPEKSDEVICKKPKNKNENISAKFFKDLSWRKSLCTCPKCMQMYMEKKVIYLLDPEDPVYLYEEKGKAKAKEIVENQEEMLLKSLPRVQLVEAIAGYNDLKEKLAEYLGKFADNQKVVRVEDIKEFFSGMNARKRQKVEMPYYCR